MGKSTKSPRCNAKPPELNQGNADLEKLLAIEWRRLEVAERIEKERNIIFPETTIIIRDIQKLLKALNREPDKDDKDEEFWLPDIDFD